MSSISFLVNYKGVIIFNSCNQNCYLVSILVIGTALDYNPKHRSLHYWAIGLSVVHRV